MAKTRARVDRRKRREEQQTQGIADHDSNMDFDPADQDVSPSCIQHWHASFFFSDPATQTIRERE